MMRAVIGIVVVATLVGVAMPGRPDAGTDGNLAARPAEPWFTDHSGAPSSASAESGEVRLTRHGDGHFYADVQVNGMPVEFMIDTGATTIALTQKDAERAGLSLNSSGRSIVGEGAGGPLTGARVTLDRVKLGHRSSESMSAVVIDGASTNLLGQSFLSRFPEVTVRGDVMTLR